MADILPAGPFEYIDLGGGEKAPLYLIPFDREGRCKALETRRKLLERVATATHLFLFSHGWNNDFPTALDRYHKFFAEFRKVREAQGAPSRYRPLLIGTVWPSTALVQPSERAPKMAALPDDPGFEVAVSVGESLAELDEISARLPADKVERFYALTHRAEPLDESEAMELADILRPIYSSPRDPAAASGDEPLLMEMVASWKAAAKSLDSGGSRGGGDDEDHVQPARGLGGPVTGSTPTGPAAAGFSLDPRGALRAFTVWQMKDRAGRVGTAGVGPLLGDLVKAAPDAQHHLIGHSYGAKVVLSAANTLPPEIKPPLTSLLLLQPAINAWAFAADVDGQGFAGGYHRILGLVRKPIFTTFSSRDVPLTKLFHLAVRRRGELGEVKVAAGGAPSRYAALGGFGPQGIDAPLGRVIDLPALGEAYPSFGEARVVALDGSKLIPGHGEVVNEHTAWALYSQVAS